MHTSLSSTGLTEKDSTKNKKETDLKSLKLTSLSFSKLTLRLNDSQGVKKK